MEELAKILAEVFAMPETKIGLELTKEDIDSWDSLKQMDLVVSLEEHYNIEFDKASAVSRTSCHAITKRGRRRGFWQDEGHRKCAWRRIRIRLVIFRRAQFKPEFFAIEAFHNT